MIKRDYYFFCCRKKKGFDWKAYVQRQINRFNKELTEDIHKVGVLIYIGRVLAFFNKELADDILMVGRVSR